MSRYDWPAHQVYTIGIEPVSTERRISRHKLGVKPSNGFQIWFIRLLAVPTVFKAGLSGGQGSKDNKQR
jgi:hypothetical protein